MLALLLAAITFHADFEAGSLGKVESVSPSHFRCAVQGEADHDGRNRQASWYYFRMEGTSRRELTIDLTDLVGEYNYQPGSHSVTAHTRPVYSYDGRIWKHFERVEWDEKAVMLRLRFTPERSPVWIAHIPPYTNADLKRLLEIYRSNSDLRQASIGRSVEGREIPLLTVQRSTAGRKKVVWIIARQHAWEAGTSWTVEGALRYLLSSDGAAEALRSWFVFKIVPIADPDGVARGGVRFNRNGYDLNRNWDGFDARLVPEIDAIRNAVLGWVDSGHRIDLLLALHNQEGEDAFEGPLEAGGSELRRLANRFCLELRERTIFYSAGSPLDSGLTTGSGGKGRMAIYQGLFRDRNVPAFLLELTVEGIPKIGRPPTVEDRMEFGAGLVKAIAASLQ